MVLLRACIEGASLFVNSPRNCASVAGDDGRPSFCSANLPKL